MIEEKIKKYIWKYPKQRGVDSSFTQNSKRLIDMDRDELIKIYTHSNLMLTNKSKNNPGRYIVLSEIESQIKFCGVELFIRWLQELDCNPRYNRYRLLMDLRTFINQSKDNHAEQGLEFNPSEHSITSMFSGVPAEYSNLVLSDVLNGALDNLGKFNRNHLTNTFICKQGIWLAKDELDEFTQIDLDGNLVDRIKLIKERLSINPPIELFINSKGLSFEQLRSSLNLKSGKKYSELTSSQLQTLRYKILPLLENTINSHINQWKERIRQIEEVAEYKGINLIA
jgi:hypothetical protein